MATTRFLTIMRSRSFQMVTRMMTFLMIVRTMRYSTMMILTKMMMGNTAAMTKIIVELSLDPVLEELGRTQ